MHLSLYRQYGYPGFDSELARRGYFMDADLCAQEIIEKVGPKIVVATPLGLGKPVQLINALYAQVKQNPNLELTIVTALSFCKPQAKNNLSARFLSPFIERVYEDYEDLLYEKDRRSESLPKNIKIIEFFLAAGSYLNNGIAQQDFISSNYTMVIRDILRYNVNVIAVMVSTKQEDAHGFASLSCNTDLTKDLIAALPHALLVGQINNNLPFMYGSHAQIKLKDFFLLLKNGDRKLFSIPKQPVSLQEYRIGLFASSLVKDDGCLQIGIGCLSDAVVHGLLVRHQNPSLYKKLLAQLLGEDTASEPFAVGLFALTEMLVDGYAELYRANILKKAITDDEGTHIAHAGFFVGSNSFYEFLRSLSEQERRKFSMRSIQEINQLYGDEKRRRRERKNATFINTCMKVTILGDVISDSLDDGRTVSGVGGQYNFVAMAHELSNARSIMMCKSTRTSSGRTHSNIVFSAGPATIPRHLRDIVVTEYGIAFLRAKTDQEVVMAMLNIADSRFQSALLRQAKKAKKLPANYEIPSTFTNNYPRNVNKFFEDVKEIFKPFPHGSDFNEEERELLKILLHIDAAPITKKSAMVIRGLLVTPSAKEASLLKRMNLERADSLKTVLYRSLLLGALHARP